MQAVRPTIGRHGLRSGGQGLSQHLAAEHTAEPQVLAGLQSVPTMFSGFRRVNIFQDIADKQERGATFPAGSDLLSIISPLLFDI